MISNEIKAEVLYNSKKKSMWTSYLLGAFLGGIGAHYFYLGKKEFAFIMIANTLMMVASSLSANTGIAAVGAVVYFLVVGGSFVHTYYACNAVNKQIQDECAILAEK